MRTPPELWVLFEPFDITSESELKKNLNYIMRSHFVGLEPGVLRVKSINTGYEIYFIGEQVLLDGDVVNRCFTRKSVKAAFANNPPPPNWDGTSEEFKNFVLAIPDDKFNAFLVPYYRASVPAFDKLSSYRDTLKILRTTAEDVGAAEGIWFSENEVGIAGIQFIDAFDFLKAELVNHVSELDNSGFSVANLQDNAIIFTAGAMIENIVEVIIVDGHSPQ